MVTLNDDLERVAQQRLGGAVCSTPAEVVGYMGAVQAQEYGEALWSLALRMEHATARSIQHDIDAGTMLRTHVMRPTWHFVLPADIRWMLELTAPRVNAFNGTYYRQLGLDDALFARSNEAIVRALEGGHYLTRPELAAALHEVGIEATSVRLAHIVMRAELDAVICSGPRRGKQLTYALLDERVPPTAPLSRDETLAALTVRYFTSHGPATLRDFAWWSGLTQADARRGLALAGDALVEQTSDGQSFWRGHTTHAPTCADAALLLPTFDEWVVGYAGFDKRRSNGVDAESRPGFYATVVLGGRIVGWWRRTIKPRVVQIELDLSTPLAAEERDAVRCAAERYGAFLELPVEIIET